MDGFVQCKKKTFLSSEVILLPYFGILPCILFLSHDVLLLKSDFFSRSEYLFGLSVGICRAVEESNTPRYACREELVDF